LKGIQIQVTNNSQTIFNQNVGIKNEKNESIDNNTLFRVASLSKSFASVAIMQLV
jgi:CubicO group peptidase (beta-lactamase class C family)